MEAGWCESGQPGLTGKLLIIVCLSFSMLPGSMLLGALVCADLLARTLVVPAELPIGIVTALLGGPFFLWLLWHQRWQGRL